MHSSQRLQDKITLVTGASRGIGAAIATAFVNEGAVCFLTDIDDAPGRALAESLGPKAHYLHLDVRDAAQWQAAMNEVTARAGALHAVVNNAGITGFETGAAPHDPEHAALADWHAVLATNLDGVFLGCQHAIRTMRATGSAGAIINISSRSGLVGIPRAAAYAASKAAVRNHSKSVALYCAEERLPIRCNSIHPAAVLTPMWDAMLGDGPQREQRMRQFTADTPLRRFGQPEEVAALAVLLASDEARYMTGSELHLDGGLLAGSAASIEAANT